MVEIIAEIGCNWSGDLVKAKRMIKKAKENGAGTVKFQMFTEKEIKDSEHFEELKKCILTKDTASELKEYAESMSIDWFASVMNKDLVDVLEDIGVKKYKLRAKDANNFELMERLAHTRKPIYLSLSEQYDYNIHNIGWDLINPDFGKLDARHIKYLYTVSKYPPEPEDLKLNYLRQPVQYVCTEKGCKGFGVIANIDFAFDGYSNHLPGEYGAIASLVAISMGAKILEIHVMEDEHCIDVPVSLTFPQLRALVEKVKIVEAML